jgi:hypothetical protein
MQTELISNEHFRAVFQQETSVVELIDSIAQQMSGLDNSFSGDSNGSSVLKMGIGDYLTDWNRDLLIQKDFPSRRFPSSHVQVDFQKEILLGDSKRKVQLTLEVFGDNRQALASNLLKLELAGRNFSKFGESIGIGVCVDKRLKKIAWDGSTATSDEYEFGLLHTYSRFIETPIVLLSVG